MKYPTVCFTKDKKTGRNLRQTVQPFKSVIVLQFSMALIVMMQECRPDEKLTSAAYKHHADPMEWIHSRRVSIIYECITGKLLARAAFIYMYYADE